MAAANTPEASGASGVGRLQFSAWAGIFVFGIVMAILGAILPSLFERIGFGAGAAGDLFLTMNFAMLLATLFFGPVVDRFGFKTVLAVAAVLVAAAFLVLSRASTYGLVLGAAVVLGLGGGALNGGTNALTSELHEGEKRGAALNVLGIFFGFGALFVPFLIGTMREVLGLGRILALATFLSLVPFIIYIVLKFPRAKHAQGFPIREAAAIARNPLLWLTGFILFFQSANEFTVGGWVSTHLQKTFGVAAGAAALVLAGYWAAIMAGRLVSSRLVRTVRGETLILGSAALSLVAALLMALAPSGLAAAAGAVLIGAGFAAIYPTTLAIVGGTFKAFTGTAFSVVIALGLVGGMLAPWLAGRIAEASSLRQGFIIPVVNCVMIAVLAVILGRLNAAPAVKEERLT
ncbi:MAG: putative transporter [Candidatus Aminicenantes bacterium]|nr:putative transporter [Candidatus Aminicenantes bacterium]